MHFLVAWDIKPQLEYSKLNNQLKACLTGYSWVRPLKNIYIVKVESVDDRKTIRSALNSVAKNNPRKINILISPLMEGGSYGGWLPVQLWEKIKKRTKQE